MDGCRLFFSPGETVTGPPLPPPPILEYARRNTSERDTRTLPLTLDEHARTLRNFTILKLVQYKEGFSRRQSSLFMFSWERKNEAADSAEGKKYFSDRKMRWEALRI